MVHRDRKLAGWLCYNKIGETFFFSFFSFLARNMSLCSKTADMTYLQ